MHNKMYTNGCYRSLHPTWHLEDSVWKARQLLRIFPREFVGRSIGVADLGCGAGYVLSHFCKSLKELEIAEVKLADGYDISPDPLREGRGLFPKLNFINTDITKLRVSPKYDLALSVDVIEHLENPDAFLASLSGCAEYILFHIPLEENWYVKYRSGKDYALRHAGHLHFYDKNSVLKMLRQAHLDIRKYVFTPGFEVEGLTSRKGIVRMRKNLSRLLYRLSPELASRTIGGISLAVQCKTS